MIWRELTIPDTLKSSDGSDVTSLGTTSPAGPAPDNGAWRAGGLAGQSEPGEERKQGADGMSGCSEAMSWPGCVVFHTIAEYALRTFSRPTAIRC